MIAGDFETTGLIKPQLTDIKLQPYMTEICFIKFDYDGKMQDKFVSFVKPPVPIPEEVSKINGIYDNTVKKAPKFIELYDDICNFFHGEKTFYAHNCSYEIDMLILELERHDLQYKFPWPTKQICTVELTHTIKNKRLSLDKLYKLTTGKEIKNAHRAEGDVLSLIEIIVKLKKSGFINETNN